MRNFLLMGMVGAALALAGCADNAGTESTDMGGGNCPDATGTGPTTGDDTATGNDLDTTGQVGGGMSNSQSGGTTTGGGDCPNAAGVDDDTNVHTDTTTGVDGTMG